MLKRRVLSSCVAGLSVVLATFYFPPAGIWLTLLGLGVWAQTEFYSVLTAAGIPSFRVCGAACGAVLLTVSYATVGPAPADVVRAYRWEGAVLFACLIAVFIRQFPQKDNAQPLQTVGCTLLGIWYAPYLLNFFNRLVFAWDERPHGMSGRLLAFYLILVVKSADMGAYFTGRRFGRHKLFPRISPAKTWEGLFGGVAAALAVSLLYLALTRGSMGRLHMGLADAIVLGVGLSLVGVVGDMFESLLKRAAGLKDSGSSVPGMGGILDVIDSLLFGAPILYFYAGTFLT